MILKLELIPNVSQWCDETSGFFWCSPPCNQACEERQASPAVKTDIERDLAVAGVALADSRAGPHLHDDKAAWHHARTAAGLNGCVPPHERALSHVVPHTIARLPRGDGLTRATLGLYCLRGHLHARAPPRACPHNLAHNRTF